MKKRVYKTVLFLFLTATFLFAFSGCTREKKPTEKATEKTSFSPQKVVEEFYNALFVTTDFDTVYNYTHPPKFLDDMRESAMSEFDEPDPSTEVYAVVVQWGYGEGDDSYDETELIFLVCIEGKWYILGNYW